MNNRTKWFVSAAVAALASAGVAVAQDKFPSEKIEMVTHSGAGGGTDLTTRFTQKEFEPLIGGPVEVVNKTGGSGAVSMAYLKSRGANGYTILTFTNTHINPLVQKQTEITIDDMIPLARATNDPQLVFVGAKSANKTLADLAKASEAKKLKWGVSNIGSIDHIAAHQIATAAKINYDAVPYRGGATVLTNLVGGDIDVAVANYAEAASLLGSNEIVAIAVLDKNRLEPLPDVPTATEAGFPVVASTIRGYVLLKGTPEDRVKALEENLIEAMKKPSFQDFLVKNGMTSASVVGQEEWGQQIRTMYDDAAKVLKELGIAQ